MIRHSASCESDDGDPQGDPASGLCGQGAEGTGLVCTAAVAEGETDRDVADQEVHETGDDMPASCGLLEQVTVLCALGGIAGR